MDCTLRIPFLILFYERLRINVLIKAINSDCKHGKKGRYLITMNDDLANIIFTGNQVWLSQKQRIRRKWKMKPIPVGD